MKKRDLITWRSYEGWRVTTEETGGKVVCYLHFQDCETGKKHKFPLASFDSRAGALFFANGFILCGILKDGARSVTEAADILDEIEAHGEKDMLL